MEGDHPKEVAQKALHHISRFSKESWSTLFKTALVRLPRAVPIQALHLTNPHGPQPFQLYLPSRDHGRNISVYIFVPPVVFPGLKHGHFVNDVPEPADFPVICDYHGGGFYLGSCLEQAPFCSKLCRELHAVVISVDYRMAPYDKFPAAIHDAEDVVRSILDPQFPGHALLRQGVANYLRGQWYENIGGTQDPRESDMIPMPPVPRITVDASRIGFSGASSGGNIALNMALSILPDTDEYVPEGWPSPIPADYATPIPLLLLYPSLDLRQLPSERTRNERTPPPKEKGKRRLDIDDHLAATYVSREMAGHPRASPGLVNTAIGLHPRVKALLILSGLDTLWEQSEIWVKKVTEEGRINDIMVMRYSDRKHGWAQIPEIALSKEERKTRLEVLEECVRFAAVTWEGRDPIEVLAQEGMGGEVGAQGRDDLKVKEHD